MFRYLENGETNENPHVGNSWYWLDLLCDVKRNWYAGEVDVRVEFLSTLGV